jgi:hypothetical protein
MPMSLVAVVDCEIRHLTHALALDPRSSEVRRALTACLRIRVSLLLAAAQFSGAGDGSRRKSTQLH